MKLKEKRNVPTTQPHMFSNADLWRLMLPLSIDQLLNSMMGTVGTLVVSNLGSAAISAVKSMGNPKVSYSLKASAPENTVSPLA